MRGANEKTKIPADDTVPFPGTVSNHAEILTPESTIQAKQTNKITVQMSHWCLWHKKEKMHVLYTNHMYPSVVSNVKVKGKHSS